MARVLVVEDDKYFNKLLCDYLELNNFQVETALDGVQAWEKLESSRTNGHRFDIVLVDMLLPRMMGAELLSKINNEPGHESIRRFAMSGIFKSEEEIQQMKVLQGLEAFYTKPFDLESLAVDFVGEEPIQKLKHSPKGLLSKHPVEKVFFDAYTQAFTGKLVLSLDTRQRNIYFLNGHPVSADSTSISESFGSSLVKLGYIDEATREEASLRMVEKQLHFGETLVEMNAIQKDELFKALRKHIYQVLINCFLSRQGEYEFFEMDEIPAHLPRIEFNPFILMFEAQKKLISIEALASLFKIKLQHYPVKQARLSQVLPLVKVQRETTRALENFKSQIKLEEFLKGLPNQIREESLRSLYLFESIGLLDWQPTPPEQATEDNIEQSETAQTDFSESFDEEQKASVEELQNKLFANYMDTLNQNFFELLQVPEDATEAQINEAYREIRYSLHPDRFDGELNGEAQRILDDTLGRLDAAYQTLSNQESREEYKDTIRRISEDSAADSKRYLRAVEEFREGRKLLARDMLDQAKACFESAYQQWRSGIEYKMYAEYTELRAQMKTASSDVIVSKINKFKDLCWNHPHSDTGFFLLGNAYKAIEEFEKAREAYRRCLELNEDSNEAQLALANLAAAQKKRAGWKASVKIKKKTVKSILFYTVMFGIMIGAYTQKDRFIEEETGIESVNPEMIADQMPAIEIRQKQDLAKITLEEEWIDDVPDPVLRTKCLQTIEKLQIYGIMRIYILESGKGLKAFCAENKLERF